MKEAGHRTNIEIAADLEITASPNGPPPAHLASAYEKTKNGKRLNMALLINRG